MRICTSQTSPSRSTVRCLHVLIRITSYTTRSKFLTGTHYIGLGPGEDYNANHGGKWSMRNLMLYIESTRGAADADHLAASIDTVIIHSLRAVQNVIINDKHCFELYVQTVVVYC